MSQPQIKEDETSVNLNEFCQEIRERALTGEFDVQAYVSQDVIARLKQFRFMIFAPHSF